MIIPECFEASGAVSVSGGRHTSSVEIYKHIPTGIEFVLVPAGEATIGSQDSEPKDQPAYLVKISPFLLSRYPVKLDVWRLVMNPTVVHQPWSPDRKGVQGLGGEYPVADASADECDEFCRRTGLELPSEAEWEYACRFGREPCDLEDLDRVAWHAENCRDIQPVGLKQSNALGLHDMLGNVSEWCSDTWHDNYAGAPTDGSSWNDATSTYRVHRGGSVEYAPAQCMPYVRMVLPPYCDGCCVGFRVKYPLISPESDQEIPPLVVPEGFLSIGTRTSTFNGVTYATEWIQHASSKVELPLLPGGLYLTDSVAEASRDIQTLLESNVIVTKSGTSHPELLNSLVSRGPEIYPPLMAHFLAGEGETRFNAVFWHAELSCKLMDIDDELPGGMPSAQLLEAAMQETDASVRSMAIAVFGGFFDHAEPFIPKLLPHLSDPECCDVTLEVFGRLGTFDTVALPEILDVALSHDSTRTRAHAVETIRSIFRFGALADRVPDEAKPSVIPKLLLLAAVPDLPGATAGYALASLDYESTELVPGLLVSLKSHDPEARNLAATALGILAPKCPLEVQDALQEHVNDPDESVRRAVSVALRCTAEQPLPSA